MFFIKFLLLALTTGFTADAIDVNCNYFFLGSLSFDSVYTCEARVMCLGSTILENVTGDHRPGYTNDDVKYFKTDHLPLVPTNLVDIFRNLIAIEIGFNDEFSITAEDLRPFPQLEYLGLWQNNLVSIDGDLFSFTPHLKFIAFAYNRIEHIGYDLLTNLNDLQYLYFNGNVCVENNTRTRAEVEELAPQLSVMCPPLEATTITATAVDESTTEAIGHCSCNDEINEVRTSIDQQNTEIAQLQQSNAQLIQANEELVEMNNVVGKRLSEVERLLGAAKNFVHAFCGQD